MRGYDRPIVPDGPPCEACGCALVERRDGETDRQLAARLTAESPGKRWWSWLNYGKGKCPKRPRHPRAHRYGACMDCWDRLVAEIKAEALREAAETAKPQREP